MHVQLHYVYGKGGGNRVLYEHHVTTRHVPAFSSLEHFLSGVVCDWLGSIFKDNLQDKKKLKHLAHMLKFERVNSLETVLTSGRRDYI